MKNEITTKRAVIKLNPFMKLPTGVAILSKGASNKKQEEISSIKNLLRWLNDKDVAAKLEVMQITIVF